MRQTITKPPLPKFRALVAAILFIAIPSKAAIISEVDSFEPSFEESLKEGIDELTPLDFEAFNQDQKTPLEKGIRGILQYIRANQYQQAINLADELLKKQPDNLDALNLKAITYLELNDPTQAQKIFQEVLKNQPGNPFASSALGAMSIDAGDLIKGRQYYEEALRKNPGHLGVLQQLARLEVLEGNYGQLKKLAETTLQQYPDNVLFLTFSASAYLQENKPAKAVAQLQKALSLAPNTPLLLNYLGQAQLQSGLPDQAIGTFKHWTDVQPQSSEAHFMLALAYSKANDKENLKTELNQVIALAPKHFRAKVLLMRVAVVEGKTSRAQKLINELKENYPNNAAVLAQEGWLAEQGKQPQKAITAYQAALRVTPENQQLTKHLAIAQLSAGDLNKSLTTLENWLSRHPDDLSMRLLRAKILHSQGHSRKAVLDYQMIIEKLPDDVFTLNSLAWLLRQDNPEQALMYAERAYKLAPEDPAIMDTLGIIKLNRNDSREALSLISKASEKMPKNPQIAYHLALAQTKNGQTSAAEKTLTRLLATEVGFPERKKALELLNNIKK